MKLHQFNRKRAINKLRFNLNKGIYVKTGTIVVIIIIMVSFVMLFAFSKYTTSKNYNVIETTVGDFSVGNDYVLAAYVDGTKTDTFPAKNTGYTASNIECTNNATA